MREKKAGKLMLPVIAVLAALIVMAGLVLLMSTYVKRSVHDERKTYLISQNDTLTAVVSQALTSYSDYADLAKNVVAQELLPWDNVYVFMTRTQQMLVHDNTTLMLADSNGNWYGSDNTTGRITSLSYYRDDTPEKLYYIAADPADLQEKLIYRLRLDQPVTVATGSGNVLIRYVLVSCALDAINDKASVALPYKCNTFLVDSTGLMLYRRLELGLLMDGSNIFTKYERVTFLYGDSSADQLAQIKDRQTVVGEFELNGENLFICTSAIAGTDLYMSFLVRADDLSSGNYVHSLFLMISMIAMVFCSVTVIAFMLFLRGQRSHALFEKEQRANQLLEEAGKAKDVFLSNMSHDIRTPINGIMGMTRLAKDQPGNPEKTRDCLMQIDAASHHLLSLVNDVLDLSTIENDKVTINAKAVDLREITLECEAITRGQMVGRTLSLESERELPHPYLMADAMQLKRVLLNLLGNAVKYTRDGGTIRITAREIACDGGTATVRFIVADNGIGMKKEFLEHIWERFSQEDGGARTEYKGTGLGMPITKNLVEKMGGEISVESELDKGSIFTVTIPLDIAPEPEKEDTDASALDGIRVLLAEDNDINLIVAQELLEDNGMVVTPVRDGAEAVAAFRDSAVYGFDMVLLDIMMPRMTGIEAAKAIRALERPDAATVPILSMSARLKEEGAAEERAAGFDGAIAKPIEPDEAVRTLVKYCHARGEERKEERKGEERK